MSLNVCVCFFFISVLLRVHGVQLISTPNLAILSSDCPQKHSDFSIFCSSHDRNSTPTPPISRSVLFPYLASCFLSLLSDFGPLIPFYCRLVVSCVKTLPRSCTQWLCGCECAAVDCLRGRGHIVFFLISRRIFCLWLRPDQLWKTHSVLTDDAHKKTTLIYLRHVHIFILQPLNRWIDIYQSLTFVVRSQFGYISRQNLSVRFRKRSLFGLE